MAPWDSSPWDAAHTAAIAANYAHYIEPDILHERKHSPAPRAAQRVEAAAPPPSAAVPQGHLDHGLSHWWSPKSPDGVSPGWHLQPTYADFDSVRNVATGSGIRIAHLDTGYTLGHNSKPLHLRPELSYDFWLHKPQAEDPGEKIGFVQPGHGTATLALLAGAEMDLSFGTHRYTGYVGGAPDAEVVEARIGPSVIHLYSSTMYEGILYAMAPSGDPATPEPANRCDVISISHGGLPSQLWADAVNAAYEDGIVMVAAAADSFYAVALDIATHYTVYPAAFNRVITSVGATFDKTPYVTHVPLIVMQGCWGPDSVMHKAVAAFTPNVMWMNYKDLPNGFDMDGGGTSATTPQMAAACALWLQLHRSKLPADWRRVEACRLAMFESADKSQNDFTHFGQGLLRVPQMLSNEISVPIIADILKADPATAKSQVDAIGNPIRQLLFGLSPPGADAEAQMYETELAQVILESGNNDLLAGMRKAMAPDATFTAVEKKAYLEVLSSQTISYALRQRLKEALEQL